MSFYFKEKDIKGLFEIKSKAFTDNRGSFLNCFRLKEPIFKEIWGERVIKQINISTTKKVGTIRGLHYQLGVHAEAKLIRCLSGKVWDVAVDIRKNSETYGQWSATCLSKIKGNAFFIPEGFAHGFQTLKEKCELLYLHTQRYQKDYERGINPIDSAIGIEWPLPITQLSKRDKNHAMIDEKFLGF